MQGGESGILAGKNNPGQSLVHGGLLPTPSLDVATHKKIVEKRRQGMSQCAVSRELGIGRGTVQNYEKLAVPLPKVNKKRGEMHWREWVPAIKQFQGLKKKASYSQDEAFVELGDGKSSVALMAFSDQHMGAWSTNYEKLIELTDEILGTKNLYVGLLGDYGHYAIKLRNVLEVSDNLLPPEQQTDFIESWFNDIWERVAFATWENHGVERQEKQAGESSTKRLLSRKFAYFNGIGHVDIKVGSQIYKAAVSHMFRGRSIENPCHGQMRYMRREGIDRDFAMSGDSHVPGMIKYTDGNRTRVAINAGSIQTGSGYAKRYFSLTTHPVYPIIVLSPDRHEMTPYWSVAEWLSAKK